MLKKITLFGLISVVALTASADPVRLYWDTSDEPGLQGGNGTWSAQVKNWSESADGSGPRVAWRAGAVAVFGSKEKQLVLAEGVPEVAGIEAAAVDVAAGAIAFPASGLEITTDGEVVLSSAVRGEGPVVKRGKGILSIGGINTLPGGFTLTSGKLRFFALDSLGKGALRVEGEASLIPWVANISMGNPISIGAAGKLALETEMPGFTISGPISGNGSLEVNGRQPVTITGLYESSVALRGVLGTINFSPAKPVKLTATIKGGLLKTGANSLAEGSKLLITESGALAASGARDGLAAWVESGWIAPESTGTLALDTSGEVSGTIDLKPFAGKYPAMSLGSCGKVVLTGKLDLPGSVLRIGGGGGDIDVRTPLSGPLQVVIGAPSTSGNVTLSSANSFTGGLRIDGGTLRVGHAQAVPAGVITMGNRLTAFNSCQLDLNNFDLPNEVKFEGGATIKNSGRRAAVFSGRINAAGTAIRLAADLGSTLKVTGPLESQGLVFIGSDMVSWNDTANLVELAPNVPNTANRVQIDRGVVLRAVEGLGLPLKARLVLNGGVFESHGEFRRPLVPHYRAVDGEGGVSFVWTRYGASGFSAHGGQFTVRLEGANPWNWGTQADGSLKPDDYLLVLNAPTADSKLILDIPLNLAGEQLDRKGQASSAHRIAVYSAEAVLAQPVTSTPDTPAGIEKLGKGQLTLQAANAFTGNMVVRDGTLCFDSPAAMAGTGRTICPDNGSVVAANFPIDNAFLQRLESPSAMAYTVALGTDSSAPLDFQSNAGAILRAATLGATGEVTYSGKITPCDGLLKLGGGGGTLKVTDPANVPTIVGGSLTPGRVVLPDGVKLPENFVLLQGSLTIGSTPYKAPEIATTISPAPMPSTPPEGVSASANDRWVDALWNFPINPEGGFAVEWSTDGKTFEPAGKAWPEERRFPIFLKNPPKTFWGAPGEVFVRVAAIGPDGKQGAWSQVAKTTCASRFDPAQEVPAQFPGSAAQRKYNMNDPERLVTYTPEEKEAQRAKGREIAEKIKSLSKTTGQTFVIPPGIYRVTTGQIMVDGAKNLAIHGPDVEIIVDDEKSGSAFTFTNCSDVILTGRAPKPATEVKPTLGEKLLSWIGKKTPKPQSTYLILDSEQLAFSLVRILAVNNPERTLDVEVLPGYDTKLHELERMLAYRPDGTMANRESSGWNKFQSLGGRMFRLFNCPNLWQQNQEALKPGHLIAMHGGVPLTPGGPSTRFHGLVGATNCGNMTYESVRIVNGLGSPADHRTAGHTIYRDWRNSPRAGTSRLELAAGLGQFSKDGGTFLFEDCEFGPHIDDGINLGGGIGMLLRQTGDKSLIMGAIAAPTPGQILTFYDFYSWQKVGEAKIASMKPFPQPESVKASDAWCARNSITSIALQRLWSVTLENPVKLPPFAAVVHSDHRCDNITVRGCLFRDQLAQIMLLQGATSGLIENNLLLGSTATAVSMQFAQYWWEGPQPSNFIIRNNVIRDNPVMVPDNAESSGAASISVFPSTVSAGNSGRKPLSECEPITSRLFSGFRIEGNNIINPGGYGVLLRNTKNAVIRYNSIIDPGSVPSPFPVTCIGLGEVSDAVISDNDLVFRKSIAKEPISFLQGCDMKTIRIENNQITQKP